MDHVHIDFETRSTVDLRKCGSDVYAQSHNTDVLCMAYAFDNGPVSLWLPHQKPPADLVEHVANGGLCIGHNIAGFEVLIWNSVLVPQGGWPELSIDQCADTMAMAFAMALPGSLDGASGATGISQQKDMKGHRVMMQLCKPRNVDPHGVITWYDKKDFPDKYKKLYEYCKQDVVVERELYNRLMKLSDKEMELWRLDFHINRRGVNVDAEALSVCLEVIEKEKKRLDSKMKKVTSNAVATTTATGQLTDWLKFELEGTDIEVPSVAKQDVVEMLECEELPENCRQALLLRQEAAKTSTAKVNAMLLGANGDGRIRGLFQYHGAGTGRWAGRRVQLQNLPRPTMSQNQIDSAFQVLLSGKPINHITEELHMFFGSPMSVVSDCVRGFLKARDGCDFIGCDFSSIEARVLAWLAGQKDKLEIFEGHGKIYEHAAASIYNIPMSQVSKDQRLIGKVSELALGYGGGQGAFQSMAKVYGVKVPATQAEDIKLKWREANPNITNFWYNLEAAAMEALNNPGKKFIAGNCAFRTAGSFLWCQLPSGRVLCYPYPKIKETETPWGELRDAIHYKTIVLNKWCETKTYGGKLCENVTQAVARDLLAESLFRLERKGYPVVMHIHDEAVVEVAKGKGSAKEVEDIMSELPAWAAGLPVSAEGWRGERFRK